MDWFSEQCGAWAQGSYGGLFSRYDTSYKTAAREAIDNCNDGDKGGKCRLRYMPVCTGRRYSEGFNSKLKNATPQEIEDLSAQNDRREYWGMLAANTDNVVVWGADYLSKSVARSEVLSTPECKGACRELVTFRNSCAAAAWEKKTRNAPAFAMDGDPVVARQKAMKLCTKNGGQSCGSFVRCSRRAYIDRYEGSDS